MVTDGRLKSRKICALNLFTVKLAVSQRYYSDQHSQYKAIIRSFHPQGPGELFIDFASYCKLAENKWSFRPLPFECAAVETRERQLLVNNFFEFGPSYSLFGTLSVPSISHPDDKFYSMHSDIWYVWCSFYFELRKFRTTFGDLIGWGAVTQRGESVIRKWSTTGQTLLNVLCWPKLFPQSVHSKQNSGQENVMTSSCKKREAVSCSTSALSWTTCSWVDTGKWMI